MMVAEQPLPIAAAARQPEASPPFRFYDNRQKYLAFVNTCNEKAAVTARASLELRLLRPTPPCLRLFAAWNAAIYVNQVADEMLDAVVTTGAYLDATQQVLKRHGGLWFNDESFVVTRKRH